MGAWAEGLEEEKYFTLGGYGIYLIHNRKNVSAKSENTDFVIFGHSHKYFHEYIDGVCWLNPGSCGRARFHLPITMAILELSDEGYEVQCIHMDGAKG